MVESKLKNRFRNRFNMKPLSNGYHYRADYTAHDFRSICVAVLARYEKSRDHERINEILRVVR